MPSLVAYASTHASAQGIAKRIAAILRASGLEADPAAAHDVGDPAGYDAFVIASTVYAPGGWLRRRTRPPHASRGVDHDGSRPVLEGS